MSEVINGYFCPINSKKKQHLFRGAVSRLKKVITK